MDSRQRNWWQPVLLGSLDKPTKWKRAPIWVPRRAQGGSWAVYYFWHAWWAWYTYPEHSSLSNNNDMPALLGRRVKVTLMIIVAPSSCIHRYRLDRLHWKHSNRLSGLCRLIWPSWPCERTGNGTGKEVTGVLEHKDNPVRQTSLACHTPAIGSFLAPFVPLVLPTGPLKLYECTRARVPLNLHSIAELACFISQIFPLIHAGDAGASVTAAVRVTYGRRNWQGFVALHNTCIGGICWCVDCDKADVSLEASHSCEGEGYVGHEGSWPETSDSEVDRTNEHHFRLESSLEGGTCEIKWQSRIPARYEEEKSSTGPSGTPREEEIGES